MITASGEHRECDSERKGQKETAEDKKKGVMAKTKVGKD